LRKRRATSKRSPSRSLCLQPHSLVRLLDRFGCEGYPYGLLKMIVSLEAIR